MNTTKVWPSAETRKAIVGGVVGLCAYLVGVIPATGGFGDLTTVQWLGAVLFVAAGYGITWATPNAGPVVVRTTERTNAGETHTHQVTTNNRKARALRKRRRS